MSSELAFTYTTSPGTNLSFVLRPECTSHNLFGEQQEEGEACNIGGGATATWMISSIIEGLRPFEVVNNASALGAARRYTKNGETYQYLSPADTSNNLQQDYTATTLALRTTCKPIDVETCIVEDKSSNAGLYYDCGNGLEGYFENGVNTKYYSTNEYKENTTRDIRNPVYFLTAAHILADWTDLGAGLDEDKGIAVTGDYNLAIILACSSTVYDMKYTRRNGTITQFFVQESNSSTADAVNVPMGSIKGVPPYLHAAFSRIGTGAGNLQTLAGRWAIEYDGLAVAFGSSAYQGTSAEEAWLRNEKIVTRIPIVPLASLLLANALYTFAGLVLLTLAVVAARKQRETYEIVERTNVLGLVAERFEGKNARCGVEKPEQLFAELKNGTTQRVGIISTFEGGYEYHAY